MKQVLTICDPLKMLSGKLPLKCGTHSQFNPGKWEISLIGKISIGKEVDLPSDSEAPLYGLSQRMLCLFRLLFELWWMRYKAHVLGNFKDIAKTLPNKHQDQQIN